jgi:hypothetical protein
MATRKPGRDRSGHVDPYAQRRRRYEAALRPLGLWELFAAMPRPVREMFWQRKNPDPVLEFDETIGNSPTERAMRTALHARFQMAAVGINGAPMSVRDFIGVIISCMFVVQHTKPAGFPAEVVRFITEARPVLEAFYSEHLQAVLGAQYDAVHAPLVAHGRLDRSLFSVRLDCGYNAVGKFESRVVVSASGPQVRDVTIRGIPRPMYRVGTGWSRGEPKWLSVSRKELGIDGKNRTLPVYVQSHALKRLHERVNLATAAPYLEAWLEDSLSKPKVVDRQGRRGQHLVVEYRIGKHRFGYLICTVLKRLVAVRTFKFLTMSNTPEGRRLEKRLKITRGDVDHLGLHALDAFTQTDLIRDPELRWLLKKCGCGHLFELEAADYAPQPKPFAAEVKRYLRRAA